MMVKFTRSMREFLWRFYREKYALIAFGHLEEYTPEMEKEYMEWIQTEEGRQYLTGAVKEVPDEDND